MTQRKGKIIETLMDNTLNYYNKNFSDICIFRAYPKTIISYINKNKFLIRYAGKGNCDYYGIYKGQYFTIEAKQTQNKKHFYKKNLLSHQTEILNKIEKCQGKAFLLFLFEHFNKICLIEWSKFKKINEDNSKCYLLINDILKNSTLIQQKDNYMDIIPFL